MNAGYGSRIQYPDHSTDELFNPCGIHCSNFEAEAIAIEASLHHLSNIFTLDVERQNNVVIFSDAKSVLQALEHGKSDNLTTKSLANTIDNFLSAHTVELTLQWIPGHVNIPGNECADRLAKKGSTCPQINTPASMNTARHIIKNNKREEWMNEWAGGSKGRSIFNHMTRPNPNDHLNLLERKQQAVIFRLRSQHAPLNAHLHRIQPKVNQPSCPLCQHPSETVQHNLFHCPSLEDLRTRLLPANPNMENTLYSNCYQLKQTYMYYIMALSRRAQAQQATGSVT